MFPYVDCNGWHAGAELGGFQGGANDPPKFYLVPPVAPPKFFRSFSESPTQTINSSPCCKTGPSSGPPKWKCLAPPLHAVIDDYKRSDTIFHSTKSWSRMGSLRQFRWFALKYSFGLYFKCFINLKTLELGWLCPVALPGYAPCGNRFLIAGYIPAQEFVIERSSCAHRIDNSNLPTQFSIMIKSWTIMTILFT